MRSAEEIRNHLIFHLNSAMKRPGMYGGWQAAWSFESVLTNVDEVDDQIRVIDGNARNRLAFVDERVSDPDESFFNALYIPHYHQRGWLRPDAVLDPAAHKAFLDRLGLWLTEPRTRAEVLDLLGPPSWRHSDVFAYLTADPADPAIVLAFHDDTVTAAWTSDRAFPHGLRMTQAGKQNLANRQTP
jgi:hypothetical protein